VLAEVVRAIKPIYNSPHATHNQRQLLETMIGAAIWYLPQPNKLWTGKLSLKAAEALNAKKPVTKDHEYPRKVAARELLSKLPSELTAEVIYALYCEKFGRFNLITREENRKLMQYQRVENFVNTETSYEKAGIRLVDVQDLEVAIRDRVPRSPGIRDG